MKILAIGAHPDDIEIFMFGLLKTYANRGDSISMIVATDGAAGGVISNQNLKSIRTKESTKALQNLGLPKFLDFPDGELYGNYSIINLLKKIIKSDKPDLIITHDPEDYHPDHRALSNYVMKATGFFCPVIFCETLMGINFIPEYYIDITPVFNQKKEAILTHKSQCPEKFLDAVMLMNRYRSAQCNSSNGNYAEVYRHQKTFPFTDIKDLLPAAPKIREYYKNNNNSFI